MTIETETRDFHGEQAAEVVRLATALATDSLRLAEAQVEITQLKEALEDAKDLLDEAEDILQDFCDEAFAGSAISIENETSCSNTEFWQIGKKMFLKKHKL